MPEIFMMSDIFLNVPFVSRYSIIASALLCPIPDNEVSSPADAVFIFTSPSFSGSLSESVCYVTLFEYFFLYCLSVGIFICSPSTSVLA